jgi:hypothetical protein
MGWLQESPAERCPSLERGKCETHNLATPQTRTLFGMEGLNPLLYLSIIYRDRRFLTRAEHAHVTVCSVISDVCQ